MNRIYCDLELDFSQNKSLETINVKQFEDSGRDIRLYLYDNGRAISFGGTETAVINASVNGTVTTYEENCTIAYSSNYVEIPLYPSLTTLAGKENCEVKITKKSGNLTNVIYTATFIINVAPSVATSDSAAVLKTTELAATLSGLDSRVTTNSADIAELQRSGGGGGSSTDVLEKLGDSEYTTEEYIDNAAESLETASTNNKTAILNKLGTSNGTIESKVDTAATTVTTAIDTAKTNINGEITSAKTDVLNKIGTPANNTISQDISDSKTAVLNKLGTSNSTIESKIDTSTTTVTTAIDTAKTNINANISNSETSIESAVSTSETNILNKLGGASGTTIDGRLTTVETDVREAITASQTVVLNKLGSSNTSIETQVSSAKSSLSNDILNAQNIVLTEIETVDTSIENKIDTVKAELLEEIKNVKEEFEDKHNELLYEMRKNKNEILRVFAALADELAVGNGSVASDSADIMQGVITESYAGRDTKEDE